MEDITISDAEIDQFASDQVESWDMDSLVTFAIDTLYRDYVKMDRKQLILEMIDYYGEDWLREKKLSVFE
ncbi:MAG: hypothetical protein EB127_30160 [Alphaproteobacteria bacterium]|nr:hypothetical protein [Alphaproteobacteria bacterium]